MFDKKAFMSHVRNETANDKMLKAGINAPFYGEIQEKKYGKKITKSHGKDYPKGTHMCATHVEHAQWGHGTPIHGEHAAPDANGYISWYNVMFEHGVERINTADVRVLAEASHENHDHHDHPGENLTEDESVDIVMEQIIAKVVSMLSGRGDRPEGSGQNYPGRGNQPTDHKKIKGKNRDTEDNNLC